MENKLKQLKNLTFIAEKIAVWLSGLSNADRAQGLLHRMIEPKQLLKQMNTLCIEMTHTRRKKDGKKERKRILRTMKKLRQCIAKHAARYRELLNNAWQETTWSAAQMQQVLRRIDAILEQLPQATAKNRAIGPGCLLECSISSDYGNTSTHHLSAIGNVLRIANNLSIDSRNIRNHHNRNHHSRNHHSHEILDLRKYQNQDGDNIHQDPTKRLFFQPQLVTLD